MKQTAVFLVVIVLSFAVVSWIRGGKPPVAIGEVKTKESLQVAVMPITKQPYRISIPSYGNVEAEERFKIHALVSGQIIERSPKFKAGAFVSKGDVLLKIDRNEYELAESEAKSALAASELALQEEYARAEQAQRDWNKTKSSSNAREFVLRKPHVKSVEAKLESAKAALINAQRNLQRTVVKASFSGRIESVHVEQGAVVTPNTLLAEGFASDYAEVRLPISTKDLPFIHAQDITKDDVAIELINTLVSPHQVWKAEFERTDASIDQSSQQLFVIARVENPFSSQESAPKVPLHLGQYVKAELKGPEREGIIAIDNELIYQGSYVYVVNREKTGTTEAGETHDTLERRTITVSFRGAEKSVVESGLEEGDLLVTTLLGQLTSGIRVEINP
jgi:RND family efflux transporter MFP subunit